jgi:hypothetical protein
MRFLFCGLFLMQTLCFGDSVEDGTNAFIGERSVFALEEEDCFLFSQLIDQLSQHEGKWVQQEEDVEEVDAQEVFVDDGDHSEDTDS